MGDDEDRAAGNQVGKRDLHQRLAFRVERRSGFIKNENGRVLEQRPGNGDALALSSGEAEALFADHRIVLFGKPLDEVVSQRRLGGRDHPAQRDIRLAIGDVVADRIVEENRLLGYVANLGTERSQADIPQVMSVDANAASGDIEEAWDQVHQSGLAGAAGTDQRNHLAPRDHQVDDL